MLGTPQGLFRSLDEGVSWKPTYPPIYRAQSAAFTAGSTIVSRGRLLHRGNLTFDRIEPARRAPFRGGFVRALTWLPGGKLYAFVLNAQASIYVTLDSARNWYARPAVGLPRSTRSIAAMAVPGRADMLLAAAGEKGLWRSLDGGLTWEPVPAAGKPVWSVTASPGAQGRVLSQARSSSGRTTTASSGTTPAGPARGWWPPTRATRRSSSRPWPTARSGRPRTAGSRSNALLEP